MSYRDGKGFVWFLAGLGFGAISGILYAPHAGSKTRQALRSKAEEGRLFVRRRARQAREQASAWADRGRDILNRQTKKLRSAYESGKHAYQQAALKV